MLRTPLVLLPLPLLVPQSEQGVCTEWGWQFFDGGDIQTPYCAVAEPNRQRPAAHRNECQDACRAIPTCRGYTWKAGVCYFKQCGTASVQDREAFSATLCTSPATSQLEMLKCDLGRLVRANNNQCVTRLVV